MNYESSILLISGIISSISLLGAIFIVITYYKFERTRSFSFKLISSLSLSDSIFYAGKLLSFPQIAGTNGVALCLIQGLLINFGELASVLWTSIVAFTLYKSVVEGKAGQIEKKYYNDFLRVGFGIPLILTVIPWLSGYFGQVGDYCWIVIKDQNPSLSYTLRIFEFYLPLWGAIGYNGYIYFCVISYLRSIETDVDIKRIALYPLILLICSIFPTLNRLYSFITGNTSITLTTLHAVFESLQGIMNAILYGMNINVRFEWKKYLVFNDHCLCLFPDYEKFKESVNAEQHDSLISYDSDESDKRPVSSAGVNTHMSNKEFEMKLKKAIEIQN